KQHLMKISNSLRSCYKTKPPPPTIISVITTITVVNHHSPLPLSPYHYSNVQPTPKQTDLNHNKDDDLKGDKYEQDLQQVMGDITDGDNAQSEPWVSKIS
ncbi:hypothetical protein M8C21_019073, partial [Ambrosia artemisiifolia]